MFSNDLERAVALQQSIREDVESCNGMPMTGDLLGELFGKILANTSILARIVQGLLEREQNVRNSN